MKRPALLMISAGLLLGSLNTQAQDRANIDPTTIVGNRELPKVLYIVPWKKPVPGDLAGRPLLSVVDEALAPIDRDVFRRQLQYQSQQQARQQTQQAKSAEGATNPGTPP